MCCAVLCTCVCHIVAQYLSNLVLIAMLCCMYPVFRILCLGMSHAVQLCVVLCVSCDVCFVVCAMWYVLHCVYHVMCASLYVPCDICFVVCAMWCVLHCMYHVMYASFLHDRPWILPWIKSISNELDITIHVIASQLSCYCEVISTRSAEQKPSERGTGTMCKDRRFYRHLLLRYVV